MKYCSQNSWSLGHNLNMSSTYITKVLVVSG